MATWVEDVRQAFIELGGRAHLSEVYEKVKTIRKQKLPNSIKSIVRRSIEEWSSDSEAFIGKKDYYRSVGEKGNGIWELREDIPEKERIISVSEDEEVEFVEGEVNYRTHITYERSASLVKLAKQIFLEKHGHFFCQVCGFDFEKVYGEVGKGFIEAHHTIPVSQMKKGDSTKVDDIAMVCSNCHKMLHRKQPWLSMDELSKLLC